MKELHNKIVEALMAYRNIIGKMSPDERRGRHTMKNISDIISAFEVDDAAKHNSQPKAWMERWIPPPGETHPTSMTKWNLVEPKYAGQTLEGRIEELRSYNFDGRAQHEVIAVYDHQQPALIDKDLMTEEEKYSIPIYENGVKTEWTVDGVIGDEKYLQLIKCHNGVDLPIMINVHLKKSSDMK